MPLTFQDRERAFEAKFAYDEERLFRVIARRDKLFADWAAAQYGLAKDEADHLHSEVLRVPGGAGHDQVLLTLVRATLAHAGANPSAGVLEAALISCAANAEDESPPAGGDPRSH